MFLKTNEQLSALWKEVVSGTISLKEFETQFIYLFLDREGWPILTAREKDFCEDILDKLYWTAENPLDEERGYGYIDYEEFKSWFKSHLENWPRLEFEKD